MVKKAGARRSKKAQGSRRAIAGSTERARLSAVAHDVDTERRILDAAHAVFVRRGTAGARMQEIADEARVNKALLHYYFRSKDRLSEAVFQRVARGLFARLDHILTSQGQLEEKVRGIVGVYLDQLSATPYAPAYVLSEVNHHPDRAEQFVRLVRAAGTSPERLLGALQTLIDAGVRTGVLRPIAARQFFVNLVSLCIFPFAARPLLCAILDLDETGFAMFIRERREELPRFIVAALRP